MVIMLAWKAQKDCLTCEHHKGASRIDSDKRKNSKNEMDRISGSWQRHITERPANRCSILKQISLYSKEEDEREACHKIDLLVHVTFSSAQISLPWANSTTVSDDHRQNDQNHDISYLAFIHSMSANFSNQTKRNYNIFMIHLSLYYSHYLGSFGVVLSVQDMLF